MAAKTEHKSASAAESFEALAAFYAVSNLHVERVKLFGFDCLRTAGKVFVKLDKDWLAMKLPAARIASLTASGRVLTYDRAGRGMKEWAAVAAGPAKQMFALAEEARGFVGS